MGLFSDLNLKPSNKFDGVRLEGLIPKESYTGKLTGESVIRQYDGFDIPYIEVVFDEDYDDVESRWIKLSLSNSDEEFFDKYEATQLKGCFIEVQTDVYEGHIYAATVKVESPKKDTTFTKNSTKGSLKK